MPIVKDLKSAEDLADGCLPRFVCSHCEQDVVVDPEGFVEEHEALIPTKVLGGHGWYDPKIYVDCKMRLCPGKGSRAKLMRNHTIIVEKSYKGPDKPVTFKRVGKGKT